MKRWKVLLFCGSIPVGISAAVLVNYLGLCDFNLDQTTCYVSDLATFLVITGIPFVGLLPPANTATPLAREAEGKWLRIQLTEEGFEALHAIMATQGDLSEKAALNRILVEQQEALRKNCQGN